MKHREAPSIVVEPAEVNGTRLDHIRTESPDARILVLVDGGPENYPALVELLRGGHRFHPVERSLGACADPGGSFQLVSDSLDESWVRQVFLEPGHAWCELGQGGIERIRVLEWSALPQRAGSAILVRLSGTPPDTSLAAPVALTAELLGQRVSWSVRKATKLDETILELDLGERSTEATVRPLDIERGMTDDPPDGPDRCKVQQMVNSEMERRFPEVTIATESHVDGIWDFLNSSGFLYPKKLATLSVTDVQQTLSTLGSTENVLATTFLVEDSEGTIKAHVSSLLLYLKCVNIGHIASTDTAATRSVLLAAGTQFALHPAYEWLKFAWRKTNRWSDAVMGLPILRFGHPASAMSLETVLMQRPFESVRDTGSLGPAATPADRRSAVAAFKAAGWSAIVSAESLDDPNAAAAVADAFANLGLRRRRELLVDGDDGGLACATVEHSSAGLSLSEFTNATRIFNFGASPRAVVALAEAAHRRRSAGATASSLLLAPPEYVTDLEAAGWVASRSYTVGHVSTDCAAAWLGWIGRILR